MSPLAFLVVGLGGAMGAFCRSKATAFLKARLTGAFPLPTLLINVTSCFIAGVALCCHALCNQTFYLALTMGFLGGFSTLSTMNYEAVELIMGKQAKTGLCYLAATYASTLGAAALGFAAAAAGFAILG